jgi:hypothetical protein
MSINLDIIPLERLVLAVDPHNGVLPIGYNTCQQIT